MAQLLVRVDEEVAREVRRIVKEKYGGRRGALSLVVEEALRQAISPSAEVSASSLLEVIDYVFRASKEGQPKDQVLANVYLMLDREFEQSIVQGVEDVREGRAREAPRGADAVEFLRDLTKQRARR